MTSEELKIIKEFKPDKEVIKANNLKNKSNRTLLYGYTCDRRTWHVYLKDEKIHIVKYRHDYERDIPVNLVEIEASCNRDYIPDKELYPSACDFEFCMLLKSKGCELMFTSEDERPEAAYYGYLSENAVLNCNECENGENAENCNQCEEFRYYKKKRK